MATTAGGTPYVESSDLVANYPAVSLALAEHIDDLPKKIVQVVRATDSTNRTTTSSSAADTGLSVTITPTLDTSLILLIATLQARTSGSGVYGSALIANSANTPISGAERVSFGFASGGIGLAGQVLIGYDSPATTSATTYKLRFFTNAGNFQLLNTDMTGQLYAIEVSA
jgi:hypothetical protein